eukprot:NODE_350_length_2900_cov_47.481095_g298_i0.p1 GENE.NODE_350_length_2900_cov_47.481095_g298_i0~~NODE_350_length_2900_cov_47.481095_g298_i0.p1  ORF type:complete len:896 (+),score=193.41 NODE_350_length_2900_cov_47.481095_g298_i0:228-2690(+)
MVGLSLILFTNKVEKNNKFLALISVAIAGHIFGGFLIMFFRPVPPKFFRGKLRWMVLKPSCLLYYRGPATNGHPNGVIVFEPGTTVQCLDATRFAITTLSRELVLSTDTPEQATDWMVQLSVAVRQSGCHNVYRFGSFAPIRHGRACCLADGRDTFEVILAALQSAQREILIADWILSPELLLLRPPDGRSNSLIGILRKRAEAGVLVSIMLFGEPSASPLQLGSQRAVKMLESQHPNIRTLRHPKADVLLWSHHDKIVVVDQAVGFLGGLDLAFGRYDDHQHRIFDDPNDPVWQGKDYYNPRVASLADLDQPDKDSFRRDIDPRMPWHDIHVMLIGAPARDLARHFILRWNAHRREVQVKLEGNDMLPLLPLDEDLPIPSRLNKIGSSHGTLNRLLSNAQSSHNLRRGPTFYKSSLPRQHVPLPDGLPYFPEPYSEKSREFWDNVLLGLKHGESSLYNVECQLLRSGCNWSLGTSEVEDSIMEAYTAAIQTSQHFIYIENQFFVSSTAGAPVLNTIAQALVDRISIAIKERVTFRVVIVLPNYPEGSLLRDRSVCTVLHWMYQTICRGKTSMIKLLEPLANEYGVRLDDYLSFFCLRQHGVNQEGQPIAEQIYVHSKLMIVDDTVIICGSANINDRSMLGDRDSEIAVVMEPGDTVTSTMDGQLQEVGSLAHYLRCKLWAEHLGLLSEDGELTDEVRNKLSDPICKETYRGLWIQTASMNSQLYRLFFPYMPNDSIVERSQLEAYFKNTAKNRNSKTIPPPTNHSRKYQIEEPILSTNDCNISDIKGTLALFPMNFLSAEDLTPKFGEAEYVAPQALFT